MLFSIVACLIASAVAVPSSADQTKMTFKEWHELVDEANSPEARE